MSKKIMIQGTSSGAGKSIIATALCRAFTSDGYNVAPFKPQNMALNSFVTSEGLEMGRAQVVQAEASNKIPTVNMNPILLKPTGNNISQVIVKGKVWDNMDSLEYKEKKLSLIPIIEESFNELANENDIIVIEGAGSPAELNMMKNDISNMKTAEILNSPVILVADIDRGGVFASIYGTIMLQTKENQDRIKGIIINKFKGRKELIQSAIDEIEKLTNTKVLGVMPYQKVNLEDEDSITEKEIHTLSSGNNTVNIEIVRLPHMSNSTDFEILRHIEDVNVRFVELDELFSNPDLIIIPGTKNTISDLNALKQSQLIRQFYEFHKKSCPIIGICGGYQMLGKEIHDPFHFEDNIDEVSGLGILNHITIFDKEKTTTQSTAKIGNYKNIENGVFNNLQNMEISGYELHCGQTKVDLDKDIEFTKVNNILGKTANHTDGIINNNLNVMGTYFHGIFDNEEFTNTIINNIRSKKGLSSIQNKMNYEEFKENEFKKLEALIRENIDLDYIYKILNLEV